MFGGQSLGGGELLMGGSAMATAQQQQASRSRSGSGSVSVPGSGGSTPGLGAGPGGFDLSNDFPTLGGGGPGGAVASGPSSGSATPSGSDGLAAALRQQQMMQQQQQMLAGIGPGGAAGKQSNLYRIATAGQGAINVAAEDFPALPGAGSGGVEGGGGAPQPQPGIPPQVQRTSSNPGSPFLGSAQAVSRGGGQVHVAGPVAAADDAIGVSNPLLNGLSGGLAGLSLSGANGTKSNTVGGDGSSNPSSSAPSAAASTSGDGGAPGSAIDSDYGLLGLLKIIRMTDDDRNALALGQDLSTLGLDLKTSDKLYDTMGSPFTENPASKEPHYNIPMCYYMNPPALKTGHLSKFTLEILFYIFYAMPKDVLQAYAAQELYSREWRYHVDLKLWFKQAAPGDGVDLSDGSAKYIYFDYQTWDRRHFSGNVQQIVGGFLSEEDVRVKFPSSS